MKKTAWSRLPFKVKVLFRIDALLKKLHLVPDPVAAIGQPLEQRVGGHPPAKLIKDPDTTVRTHEVQIESRGGPLNIRVYQPQDWVEGGAGVLYIHGGGFSRGGLDACDHICRQLAKRAGVVVASVAYRLSPETQYPGPLEDCEDALRWFVTTRPHGIDINRVGVGGDSAGGNLAAALAIHMRDIKGPVLKHQSLIYPTLDATVSSPSWEECAGAGINRKAGRSMFESYAGDRIDEPLISPLFTADLSGLPATFVMTADFDTLRDEGFTYAEKLVESGVKTRHSHYEGTGHAFLSLPALYPNSEAGFAELAAEVRAGLAL